VEAVRSGVVADVEAGPARREHEVDIVGFVLGGGERLADRRDPRPHVADELLGEADEQADEELVVLVAPDVERLGKPGDLPRGLGVRRQRSSLRRQRQQLERSPRINVRQALRARDEHRHDRRGRPGGEFDRSAQAMTVRQQDGIGHQRFRGGEQARRLRH
jgi:hypothetical protein